MPLLTGRSRPMELSGVSHWSQVMIGVVQLQLPVSCSLDSTAGQGSSRPADPRGPRHCSRAGRPAVHRYLQEVPSGDPQDHAGCQSATGGRGSPTAKNDGQDLRLNRGLQPRGCGGRGRRACLPVRRGRVHIWRHHPRLGGVRGGDPRHPGLEGHAQNPPANAHP